MRTILQRTGVVTALAVSLLAASPASATNVLISAAGASGANDCLSIATACSLNKALSDANPGDFIQLVTGGNYFSHFISKEITIFSTAGATLAGGESPCLTINANADDVITLDGVNCAAAADGNHGIVFNTGKKLRFRNGTIRGTTGTGCGIVFTPNSDAELFVDNSVISENGTTQSGAGVCILPFGSADVIAVFNKVYVQNNRFGIRTIAANLNQIIEVLVQNSVLAGNFTALRSTGETSTMRVSNSAIYGNEVGVTRTQGGLMISLGGNVLRANGSNGGFSSTEVKE